MSIINKTKAMADAINDFKAIAPKSTESQILEAEKLLQIEGLSKDAEIILMRVKIEFMKEKIRKYESEGSNDSSNI